MSETNQDNITIQEPGWAATAFSAAVGATVLGVLSVAGIEAGAALAHGTKALTAGDIEAFAVISALTGSAVGVTVRNPQMDILKGMRKLVTWSAIAATLAMTAVSAKAGYDLARGDASYAPAVDPKPLTLGR